MNNLRPWPAKRRSVHFSLSRMATLPYCSMGMARSGALSGLKSPVAKEKPPWKLMVSQIGISFPPCVRFQHQASKFLVGALWNFSLERDTVVTPCAKTGCWRQPDWSRDDKACLPRRNASGGELL